MSTIVSSGDSFVIPFPTFVVKVFPNGRDTNRIVENLLEISSDRLVKVYAFRPNFIVYERLTPLRPKLLNEAFVQVLCDVASALFDIHIHGFIHGDVSLHNIGLNSDGNFVLFDFDTLQRSDDPYHQYRDVKMFLDNILLYTKGRNKRIVRYLMKKLQKRFSTSTIVKRKFMGRTVKRTLYTSNYPPDGFVRMISEYFFT